MNVEENRLRTFGEWPTNAAVDAVRIAKAGFYYTGRGLKVQCFLCGTEVSDWNYGDQAMARHRLANSSCPFVVNSAGTCNVPLIPTSTNSSAELTTATTAATTTMMTTITTVTTITTTTTTTTMTTTTTTTTTTTGTQQSSRIENNPDITQSQVMRSKNPLTEYGTVSQRLRSFSTWPIPFVISPERLAKAGFYYLQFQDVVECAFCNGVLTRWEAGDDPDNEHRIHFPNCDFYMRRELEDDMLELTNVTLMPNVSANLTELGIQAHTAPSNPKNTTYEERLRTYVGWPTDHKQTPEMLAAAGFYYTGSHDQVRCFHCDGGLRNWEPHDDVWFEHARWFPTCNFVNLTRGQEFVKHCVDNRPPLDPKILADVPEEDNVNVTVEAPAPSIPTVPQFDIYSVTDTAIARLLDTAPALTALEIGLSIDRVKRALKKRMEDCGIPYTEPEELIEDVLHDQMMEEYTSTSDSSSVESINSVDQVVQTADNSTCSLSDAENSSLYLEINKDSETKVYENKEATNTPNKESKFEEKKMDNKSNNITLQEENRRLKEARLCKICMDDEVAIVFLPCGHLVTCIFCAPSLTCCPMCRVKIRASVRTFLS